MSEHTWLYFALSGVSPSLGPTITETALITFFTPIKYSGFKVLSFVMSPTTLVSTKRLVGRNVEEVKGK